jgi:hypothetical protein
MPDSTPTTVDRTVVVQRYGALTWISLVFNALILLLILISIVSNHHNEQDKQSGWDHHRGQHQWGNRGHGDCDRHDEGGMRHQWGHHDFGGGRGEGNGPGDGGQRGFGMQDHQGWGGGNRPGFGEHGPGGPGEMGRPDKMGMPGGMPMMPQNAEAMTDRLMLMMTGKLKLTDAESTQIRPIVQGQIEQLQKDMEAQKGAHQKMIDDAKTKIRTILTPDQQKQFDQMMAGMGGPKAPDQSAPAGK